MTNFYSDKRKILFYILTYIIAIPAPIPYEFIILKLLSLFIPLLILFNTNFKFGISKHGISLINFIGTEKLIKWVDIKSFHIIEEPYDELPGDHVTLTIKFKNPQLSGNLFIKFLSKILDRDFFINKIKLTDTLFSKEDLYKITEKMCDYI